MARKQTREVAKRKLPNRQRRELVPSELFEAEESNEIEQSAGVYLGSFVNNQESSGRSGARQLDANRITSLLDEPLDNVAANEDEAARRTNSISASNVMAPGNGNRGETRQTILPAPNQQLDQPRSEILHQKPQQASHFNTSDCLLVLLIGYILWQCILKNRKKRARCLKRLRSLRDKLFPGFEQDADEPGESELSSQVLGTSSQFPSGSRDKAEDAIEPLEGERNETKKRRRLIQLKYLVAKNSFVVAVGDVARPKVKLLNEHVRSLRDATEAKTAQWTFSRSLKTKFASLFGKPKADSVDIELGQPDAFCPARVNQPLVRPTASSAGGTIEAIVHRNDDVRSDTLLGFAGSFLEQQTRCSPPTFNGHPAPTRALAPGVESQTAAQNLNTSPNLSELPPSSSSNSHFSASLLSASSTSNNLNPMKLSPIHRANALVNQNLLSACNAFEVQCPLQTGLLARSKSQSTSPNYVEARTSDGHQQPAGDYHAKSASPNICRPCSSTSPRNQPPGAGAKPSLLAGLRAQALNVNYHSLLGCSGQAGSCNFPSGSPHSASNGRQCQSSNNSDRLKHHYENYYDDECEDAYKRLTASIGMQFGLDFDPASCTSHHQQPPFSTAHPFLCGQSSLLTRQRAGYQQLQQPAACRCCPSSARLGTDVPSSSANTSLGGSDSGHFSLDLKLDPNNSSCQNPACTLCRSSPLAQAPLAPGMSILVQQPSVSDTPPPAHPPPQKSVDFQTQPNPTEADASPATLSNHSLVSRWNQRRRSTMSACSRSPRRMSLAAVSNWPTGGQAGGILTGSACQHDLSQSHLLHRASIASDGQRQHHHPLERYQPYSMQTGQTMCPGHSRLGGGSQYSSSAGSSSGIGVSGSQCTNTPTTSIFPYGSFMGIGSKQADPSGLPTSSEQLVKGQPIGLTSQSQYQCCAANYSNLTQFDATETSGASELMALYDPNSLSQLHLSHQLQMSGLRQPSGAQMVPIMCQGSIKGLEGSSATSRKYSLPVQLESNAAEMAEQKRSPNLLFKMPGDGDDENVPSQSQMDPLAAAGPIGDASAEIPRRSSQTIARQSSFWLEDNGEHVPLPVGCRGQAASANKANDLPVGRARSGSPSSRPASSASPSKSPSAPAKKHNRPPSSSSSSSAATSPSPDFSGARSKASSSRPLGLGASGVSISKRQTLARLQARRAKRRISRAERQKNSAEKENSSKSHSLELNSTDDDRSKASKDSKTAGAAPLGRSTEHEDSFGSSLDRDFLAAPPPTERKIRDSNSASLERQCRDLWKLRSTLNNDASFGDNWSNYHQRLNRRYDSGYKSIENQFNSSLEGNMPIPSAPTAEDIISDAFESPDHQTKLDGSGESEKPIIQPLDPDLLVRPQSGCSGFIRDNEHQSSLLGRRSTTPVIDDEETQALLADCDQHHDEPSPVGDAKPTQS